MHSTHTHSNVQYDSSSKRELCNHKKTSLITCLLLLVLFRACTNLMAHSWTEESDKRKQERQRKSTGCEGMQGTFVRNTENKTRLTHLCVSKASRSHVVTQNVSVCHLLSSSGCNVSVGQMMAPYLYVCQAGTECMVYRLCLIGQNVLF